MMPSALSDCYAPFLQASVSWLGFDPWSSWLGPLAFPYGYVMWLTFLPLTLVAAMLALLAHYGYWATLAAIHTGLLFSLRRLLPDLPTRQLLIYYWLSPIVLLASYGPGLNDLVPLLLMALTIGWRRGSGMDYYPLSYRPSSRGTISHAARQP